MNFQGTTPMLSTEERLVLLNNGEIDPPVEANEKTWMDQALKVFGKLRHPILPLKMKRGCSPLCRHGCCGLWILLYLSVYIGSHNYFSILQNTTEHKDTQCFKIRGRTSNLYEAEGSSESS